MIDIFGRPAFVLLDTVQGYATNTGALVWAYSPCHPNDPNPDHQNEAWTINANGTVVEASTGKCLDVKGDFDGAPLLINDCSSRPSQLVGRVTAVSPVRRVCATRVGLGPARCKYARWMSRLCCILVFLFLFTLEHVVDAGEQSASEQQRLLRCRKRQRDVTMGESLLAATRGVHANVRRFAVVRGAGDQPGVQPDPGGEDGVRCLHAPRPRVPVLAGQIQWLWKRAMRQLLLHYCSSRHCTRVCPAICVIRLLAATRLFGNGAMAVPRLNIASYQWWSEGLHGVAYAPGVTFGGPVPAATSFPQVGLTAATFNASLFAAIGAAIGREGRAMANIGYSGLTFWTPVRVAGCVMLVHVLSMFAPSVTLPYTTGSLVLSG